LLEQIVSLFDQINFPALANREFARKIMKSYTNQGELVSEIAEN